MKDVRKDPPAESVPSARIRLLEEVSLNAWPALQTSLYDGWVIRFADGFSRRSNSVIPLYPSAGDVMEKIRLCEAMYRERGQRTVFKHTTASEPRELDLILSDDGYRPEAETGVRTLSLRESAGAPGAAVRLQDEVSEEWMASLCTLNGYPARHHATVRALTRRIQTPRTFASVRHGGGIIGCGLGVVRQGFLAVFDIVVDKEHRRQGLGRQVMQSLLDWGRRQAATTAFLQVMSDNPVAMEMYSGLGFREEYRYVYWAKD